MRKIGLRQFNRNLYKEIRDLPLVITKDKEPYLLVLRYGKGLEHFLSDKSSVPIPPQMPTEDIDLGTPPPAPVSFKQRLKNVLSKKIV